MLDIIYTRLGQLGYYPKKIIDCGAYTGTWSGMIRRYFPEAELIAIDANDKVGGVFGYAKYSYFEVLSDVDGKEVVFYKQRGGCGTGDSIFRQNSFHYDDNASDREVRYTKTLKTIIDEVNFGKVDLIKLDVQGAELNILKGMGDYLYDVDFIQAEISIMEYNLGGCTFDELYMYIREHFEFFDITEFMRNSQKDLMQIDVLFKNKKLALGERPLI